MKINQKKYNKSKAAKKDATRIQSNGADCEQERDGDKNLIRFMTKADILGLLEYEKLTGYYLNRMPNEAFIDGISDEMKLPVGMVMIHNGIEMRASINAGDGLDAFIDMPFKTFFSLPAFDMATGQVEVTSPPANIPTDPPRKGINVEYNIPLAKLRELDEAGKVASGDLNRSGTDFSMDDLMKGEDAIALPVFFAKLIGFDEVCCYAGSLLSNRVVEVSMSVEEFFNLPERIVVWPGWDKIRIEDTEAA
jgi:hypothetical protein